MQVRSLMKSSGTSSSGNEGGGGGRASRLAQDLQGVGFLSLGLDLGFLKTRLGLATGGGGEIRARLAT